jgi:2-dehydropantoate 2-reductase
MSLKKSFLIIGAGAIGTYLGASLALQGHPVAFLEKEPDIAALKQRGLKMVLGEDQYLINEIEYFSDLEILLKRKFDLVILTLKTYHLDGILPGLIMVKDHLPLLLCLQNGVESEFKLTKALDGTRIISGTMTSAVDRLEKGSIVLQKLRGMGIAGNPAFQKEFQTVFNQAGLNCQHFRLPIGMKWSKLITNLLGNASSAILNLPPKIIFNHPGLYQMELDQIREALKVMKEQSIPITNLPGIPVRLLAAIVNFLPAGLSQPVLSRLIGGGRGEKMPSFHIDLYSGKDSSEVEDLNGAVVRAGEVNGIATPVNRFLTNRLLAMIAGEIPLGYYQNQPELFLKELQSYKKERILNE